MKSIESVVLFVEDIAASKGFYAGLLGLEPLALSPSFASFALEPGPKLELWERKKVQPAATATGGGAELCFSLPDAASLNELFEEWKGRGIAFAQVPTAMVFGLSFVALDPDGHRIRVTAGG
jgi:catechol 2,3-dioxygenase-like lactoylglutathione lyase family enzyme